MRQQENVTHKVGQTGLVFGVLSGFITRSEHARLQISVYSGYYLCHPDWYPDSQTAFWPAYINSTASWAGNQSRSPHDWHWHAMQQLCCGRVHVFHSRDVKSIVHERRKWDAKPKLCVAWLWPVHFTIRLLINLTYMASPEAVLILLFIYIL